MVHIIPTRIMFFHVTVISCYTDQISSKDLAKIWSPKSSPDLTLCVFQALAKEEFSGAVHCFPKDEGQDNPHRERDAATGKIGSDILLVKHWEPLVRKIKSDSESDLFRMEYTSMEYQMPYVVFFVRQAFGPALQCYVGKAKLIAVL